MSQSPSSVWNNCLSFIEDNIQPQAYNTWFKPIIPVKVSDKVLSIQVPSKFFYEWLEEHYIKILKLALTKELGKDARLVYIIKMENTFGNKAPFTEKIPSSNNTSVKSQNVETPFTSFTSELKNPFVIPGIRNLQIESQLNPNYTFDNFLEGDSNRLARSAGLAVASKPGGTSFNPLLIYGGVGLGKTHLVHAIGVSIKKKYPDKTVLYISAEKFTQQYIDSVKKNNRNDFIHFYQVIDILIVDDRAYGEISFASTPQLSLSAAAPNEYIIEIGTFSKTIATGIRVAWIIASDSVINKLDTMRFDNGGSNLMQRVVHNFVSSKNYLSHLEHIRNVYEEKRDISAHALEKYCGNMK
mgnify:CR=1 FL=1